MPTRSAMTAARPPYILSLDANQFLARAARRSGQRESEKILRSCVHCGFCTATCPTYVLLGDELDSPRGRIYLIKDMLENGKPATTEVVKHIDRCLSCLSCMTTCPSGVHYMHLVDHARAHIEETYRRPVDRPRSSAALLARCCPIRGRFRAGACRRTLGEPLRRLLAPYPRRGPLCRRMLDARARTACRARAAARPADLRPGAGRRRRPRRAADRLRPGGAAPAINEATIRLLNRHGVEVVLPKGEGCCGALVHHMGRDDEALAFARRNIDAWTREIDGEGLDAILITASGCGTTIKDYGFMLREDPAYAEKAARVSALAKDITEYLEPLDSAPAPRDPGMTVAYHSACSMQHGQQITTARRRSSQRRLPRARHARRRICAAARPAPTTSCSPRSPRLRDRKVANIAKRRAGHGRDRQYWLHHPDRHRHSDPDRPTVELLDWATAGRSPMRWVNRLVSRPRPFDIPCRWARNRAMPRFL